MRISKQWVVPFAAIAYGAGCAPDLVVQQVDVDWNAPTRTAAATIANVGNADAGEFLVYFNGDEFPESRNRRPQVRHTVTGLAAGASVTLLADFAPLAHPDNLSLANVYQVTVLADPKSTIDESDEGNNFDRELTYAPVVELHDAVDALVPANPPTATTAPLPVLFVHGHNRDDPMDVPPNYRKNWQLPLDYSILLKLPSFKIALDENPGLGVEPYYIRLADQHRSVTQDAAAIREAVDRILQRHGDPAATVTKVVIIAYSKGTVSTRWYLRHMVPASRPISEFIAIAPPNHGLQASSSFTTPSLALRQLNNGFDDQCVSFNEAESADFIERLNGHPIQDTMTSTAQGPQFAGEAPGSRADGDAPNEGVLYLALYADAGRDFVGGSAPSGDCQGRVVAKNLAPDAEFREVPQIVGITSAGVHVNTVHTPEVICLALYSAAHHAAPPAGLTCAMPTVDGRRVPVIPPP